MDILFLRLPERLGASVEAVVSQQGRASAPLPLADAAALKGWLSAHQGLPLVLVTPPACETTVVIEASARQRREAGSGLVALAEEQLAEDYEQLHWTLTPLDDRQVLARGIRSSWLQHWLSWLEESGAEVIAAVPEQSLYDVPAGQALWLPQGSEVMLQLSVSESAVVPADQAAELLADRLAGTLRSDLVLLHPAGCSLPALATGVTLQAASWQRWSDCLTGSPRQWRQHRDNWLHGALDNQPPAPTDRRLPWAVALITLAFATQGLMDRLDARRDATAAEAARQQAEQRFRSWYPDERRVTDVERQLRARLAGADRPDLSQLLQLLAQNTPADLSWQLRELSYQEADALTLEVSGGTLTQVQAWVEAVSQQGIAASLQSSRQDNGLTIARLRISLGGRP